VSDENITDTKHEKLLLAHTRGIEEDVVNSSIELLMDGVNANEVVKIDCGMHGLVPEYSGDCIAAASDKHKGMIA